jgi:hypothetical protein
VTRPAVSRTALFALRTLGVVWTLPNTAIGLAAGLAAMCFGAKPRFDPRDCALVFDRLPWGPGGAITFGNVILNTHADLDGRCRTYAARAGLCEDPMTRIGDHERAHVFQYMALGPLFLPLYLAFGGVSVRNPFERAADRYAMTGRDWWPWLRVNSMTALRARQSRGQAST